MLGMPADPNSNSAQTLLIDADCQIAGRLDGTTGRVELTKLSAPQLDDLLDSYRFEMNKVALKRVPLSLEKMIAECAEDLLVPCQERGLAIATEWQEFRNPDFEVMRRLLREKVIFDGRNLYDPKIVSQHGFAYHAIGRRAVTKD